MNNQKDLSNTEIKEKKCIVIYTRPWFSKFYNILASELRLRLCCKVDLFSDYGCKGAENLLSKSRALYLSVDEPEQFSEIEPYILDIILRDRLLRNLDVLDARKRIFCFYHSIVRYFESKNVSCVITATIDQYFIDLVNLYCQLHKIPVLGYSVSIIPDKVLMTVRGEATSFRNVTKDEVENSKSKLQSARFRPEYIPGTGKLMIVGWLRYFANIARFIYFGVKKANSKNLLNYHIECSFLEAKRRKALNVALGLISKKDPLPRPQEKFLYLPLQLHPECNSEYWWIESSYIDYEDLIIRFVENNIKSWKIVIKEHPNMIGMRSGKFYAELKNLGCTLCDWEISQRELIGLCEAVVTLNSSVAIESVLAKKPVFCLSESYYITSCIMTITYNQKITQDLIDQAKLIVESDGADDKVISKILSCSVPCKFNDIKLKINQQSYISALNSANIFIDRVEELIENARNNNLIERYSIRKIG